MVEAATLYLATLADDASAGIMRSFLWIWNGHRSRTVEYVVAFDGHGIDIFESVDDAHFGKGANATWLEELADDAVRLVKVTLEKSDFATRLA